ncbi:SpaA isopeptide-forming pilin-related protein [Enemella sp. A6]|uniref:SpaA isopeptide-forming pilin-related protein n=1 Tax=Enemella sp. A6 TaxID=3440152 RepID=UPI003EB8731D
MKSNLTRDPLFFRGLSDDRCGNIEYVSGLQNVSFFDRRQIRLQPGATATFRCTQDVRQTTLNTATATFSQYSGSNWGVTPVAKASETVTVEGSGGGNSKCNTLWYSTGNTSLSSSNPILGELGYFNNPGPGTTVTRRHTINYQDPATPYPYWRGSAASAVSTTNPDWVYFIPRDDATANYGNVTYGRLWAYNNVTGERRKLSNMTVESNRLGVAPDGSLWAVTLGGQILQFTPNSPTNPTGGTWVNQGSVTGADFGSGGLSSGDLAFDGSGTMWIIGSNRSTGEAHLYTLDWRDLINGGGARANEVGTMGTGEFNGIAFTEDGRLWATAMTAPATGRLYLVNKTDGSTTLQETITGKRFEDLGSCALPTPELRVTKEVEPTGTVTAGQVLTYTIKVENIGTGAATGVTLQDRLPDGVTYVRRTTRLNGSLVGDTFGGSGFPYASARLIRGPGVPERLNGLIEAKTTATITFQVRVEPGQDRVCNQGNIVYVGGPNGGIVTDDPTLPGNDDTTCVDVVQPVIEVDKSSPVTKLTENPQAVTFEYAITTTGTDDLRDVTLTDDKCTAVAPVLTPGTQFNVGDVNQDNLLNVARPGDGTNPDRPAETWKYTCVATLTEASFTNGQHINTATATGIGVRSGTRVNDTDPWTITLPTPKISLEKTGSTDVLARSPQDVTYTYVVKPTGSEEPLANVQVTDDKCAPAGGTPGTTPLTYVSGDTNNNQMLDLDEAWTFTCTSTLRLDEGTWPHVNVATTRGDGAVSKRRVTAQDDWTVRPPMKTIEKTSTRPDGTPITDENPLRVGEEILYTITVTNTSGDVTLNNLVLNDALPEGTTYVPNSTKRLYWETVTDTETKTGTYRSGGLGPLDFIFGTREGASGSAQQTFSTAGKIPDNAQLTGYTVTMNGISYDDPARGQILGGCDGFLHRRCQPAQAQDVSVTATLPGGGSWFGVGAGEFGTGYGNWNTVTRGSTTATGSAVGTYTLTWSDASRQLWRFRNDSDNTAATEVVLDYQYQVTANRRSQVSDTLGQPPNFIRAEEGISLEPGESAVVTFRVKVNEEHPARIVNTAVASTDETPPIEDSTDDPTAQDPDFAIRKAAEGGEAGGAGARVDAVWDADTQTFSVTADYTVTVSNTGEVAAPHPQIDDLVTLPPGFTVEQVTVDGVAVQLTNGHFTIPPGTVPMGPQAATTYQVRVIGRSAPGDWAAIDWEKAGTCNTEGAGTPADGGFFNQVQMDPDSDGVANNDACVPVDPPTEAIAVEKLGGQSCDVGQDTCPIEGAAFDLYDTDPSQAGATPIATLTVDPNQGWRHTAADLDLGDYWLVETKSPTGHELLAEPIAFTLTPAGITLTDGTSDGIRLKDGDTFTIEVVDTTTGDLPMSGGDGVWPYWIVALLLIGAGVVWHRAAGPSTEERRAA